MPGRRVDPGDVPRWDDDREELVSTSPWGTILSQHPEGDRSQLDITPARAPDRRRRWRHLRQTFTFALLFVGMVVLGLFAYAAFSGRIDLPFGTGQPAALPTCPSVAPTSLAPTEVDVNVFNASDRSGLAYTVARDLQKRGFQVPTQPANDPLRAKVTSAAVVRHGAKGALAAKTVAGVVAGQVKYVLDDRPGAEVDLVLGPGFKLRPAAAPAPAPVVSASPTCRPVEG